MILAHVNGMRLFLWAKQAKKNAAIEKTLRLSCRLVSVAVCIQKEHRKGCPRKQGLAVVEDEYFVYAGRATARDFLSDADQFSAGARFDIIDGSGLSRPVAKLAAPAAVSARENNAPPWTKP